MIYLNTSALVLDHRVEPSFIVTFGHDGDDVLGLGH